MTNAQEIRDKLAAGAIAATAPIATKLVVEATDQSAVIAALQNQLAHAMQVIAGKAVATVVPLDEPVLFHSASPHIRFPINRVPGHCEFFHFVGGRYSTSDPAEVKALDAAIAAGGSGFSRAPIVGPSAEEVEMRADVLAAAAVVQKKMIAAGEKTA